MKSKKDILALIAASIAMSPDLFDMGGILPTKEEKEKVMTQRDIDRLRKAEEKRIRKAAKREKK